VVSRVRAADESEAMAQLTLCRCVLGELYNREPILPGGPNDDDQLRRIAVHCGPLNEETFPGWSRLPGFPGLEKHPWDREVQQVSVVDMARKWG
jgi:serine/threonine-protein kinase BUR1